MERLLRAKYQDDNGLLKGWGALKPGESLTNSSIAPAPAISQKNDYPEERADDLTHFLADLSDGFHQISALIAVPRPKRRGRQCGSVFVRYALSAHLTWSYNQSLAT